MLKVKAISKKIIPSVFIFSLILHFYLSAISGENIFISGKANFIFNHFNVSINILFMFILLLVTTIEFSKFLYFIEINSNNTKNLKWMIKKDHLRAVSKLVILTAPFVILYLIKFFSKQTDDLEYSIGILIFASSSFLLMVTLIILFFVYKFAMRIEWVENYDKEFDFLVEQIFFNSIFLNILNYDQKIYSKELKDEIKVFLTSTNIEKDTLFSEKVALFLKESKKATTPPALI
ncbi:hypothetical protein [Spiroplasma floricola]|uniref:Transmembrane protein n=1 Tax=Spiroplasma floricola 23-6 TaxID=1336749 RepID=A0A2K8SF25_9MOLU|nr:hypothetical protein [Spiroplasma floricola]AUB32059.1 hypothetical protein SFLOR_v1c10110 [Spiroplasma floricola 23-6]